MVKLKAKGNDPYVDAMLPTNLAQMEHQVVLTALREAIETVVTIASSEATAATESGLSQLVVLKRLNEDILKEAKENLLMLRAVEARLMEI